MFASFLFSRKGGLKFERIKNFILRSEKIRLSVNSFRGVSRKRSKLLEEGSKGREFYLERERNERDSR